MPNPDPRALAAAKEYLSREADYAERFAKEHPEFSEGRLGRADAIRTALAAIDALSAKVVELETAVQSAQQSATLRALGGTFQTRVQPWMLECFGAEIAADELERDDRFLEEALELVQAGRVFTKDRAHALVDYVFDRPPGDPKQEVGGVMVTLAAHCLAHGLDMHAAGETELARVWTKIDQIRAKQASKPKGSALPIATSEAEGYDFAREIAKFNELEAELIAKGDSGRWAIIRFGGPKRWGFWVRDSLAETEPFDDGQTLIRQIGAGAHNSRKANADA